MTTTMPGATGTYATIAPEPGTNDDQAYWDMLQNDQPVAGDLRDALVNELVQRKLNSLEADAIARQLFAEKNADRARQEAAGRTHVRSGAAFILDVPTTPPAVWGKGDDILWAEGEAFMLVGPQGTGKTTILGQIIKGLIGLGGDVLGFPVATKRRVLYLAMDRPQQAARNIHRLFTEADRPVLDEKLRVWSGPPPADLAAAPETLLQMCQEHEADVVMLDSLKDAAVGLSKDEVGAGYNRARQLCLAAGIQVMELHHQRKAGDAGGKPTSINDVFGSVWLTSGAGSVVLLWGEPGDPMVEFIHLKQPINLVGPFNIVHDQASGLSARDYDEDRDVLAMARRCPSGMSVKDAAAVMFGKEEPDRGQVEKARRKLQTYTRKGQLVERKPESAGAGGASRWYAPARPEDELAAADFSIQGTGGPGGPSLCPEWGHPVSSVEHEIACVNRDVPVDELADFMKFQPGDIAKIRNDHRRSA